MLEGACFGEARFANSLQRCRVGRWAISDYVSLGDIWNVKARYHIKLYGGRQES